jgi:hypothetical protein
MWLQRNRTPPAGNGLLAAALINPAPPTLRQTFASETMTIPIRSWPTTSPALRYRRGSPRRLPDPASISPLARSRSAPWRCSAARSLRLLRSMWTCWSPSGRRASLPPLGEVPDNVHVERFVAQSVVLPLIDIIVHHGGTASTLEVGPPQLLLPQGADQSFNAEILTAAGAARALNDAHEPGAIGEAVQELLGDPPERQVGTRLRDEIAAMPSPAEVVPALVKLAGA